MRLLQTIPLILATACAPDAVKPTAAEAQIPSTEVTTQTKAVAKQVKETAKTPESILREAYTINLEPTVRDGLEGVKRYDLNQILGAMSPDQDVRDSQTFEINDKQVTVEMSAFYPSDDVANKSQMEVTVDGRRYKFTFTAKRGTSAISESQHFGANICDKGTSKCVEIAGEQDGKLSNGMFKKIDSLETKAGKK